MSGIYEERSLLKPSSDPELKRTKQRARGDFWFRLFNHATLAMAGVCLVHGEAYFLPLLPWCLPPYLALLLAAFRAEGRWVLPNIWANILGVAIVIGMSMWVLIQSGGPHAIKSMDEWASLVPYIGPFLMALLAVQLFRSRGPNDFWVLQGMGLVQVALGCVLASSPLFGLLMAVYLTCALGCLGLHYLSTPGTIGKPPSWQWLVLFVVRFSLPVAGFALAVFLLTPRSQSNVWDPLQRFGNRSPQAARWAPPGGPNQGANLNGMAPVDLSSEEAFTFRAVDAKGPKLNLSPDIRFRGLVLENYQDGVWPADSLAVGFRGMSKENPRNKDLLPDFGPGQFFLHFDLKLDQAGGLVLAEPVQLGTRPDRDGRILPAVLNDFNKPHAPLFFLQVYSGTVLPVPIPTGDWSRFHYKQVVPAPKNPNRNPANISGIRVYSQMLTKQALPHLEKWTMNLLRRLATEPRYDLPAAILTPDPRWPEHSFLIHEDQYERVALALCKYLTTSGEYTYSLEQRRVNLNIDPIEDFLFNVKEGHCERYASALVLMLRTQGIPARLIKGYRGAEALGGGAYIVRQNMAHAWVEVLVPPRASVPVEAIPAVRKSHEWLTLDPTPGAEAVRQPSKVAEWWKDSTSAGANVWQRMIVGYDAKRQGEVLSVISPPSVSEAIIGPLLWCVLYLVGLIGVGRYVWVRVRRAREPIPASAAGAACYARLVRLLARRGKLRRQLWQTPRELAGVAHATLAAREATASLADLPGRIVELFYRVRFGGKVPGSEELMHLNARLDELATALSRTAPLNSGNAH
jgi:transglutaminase-like putative cysteine protease